MSEDIVKIKYKATAELVADGIKKAIKPSDVKKEAQQTAKAMQSAMDGQKIEIPAEIVPDTSKFDKAKKEAEKPIKTPVKLETEDVDLPLLGKTPIKLSIDKDSRTAIKKTLKDAESVSDNLIKAATEAVKKIGSANYLEDLNDRERQAISTAVSKVKRNHPEISDDRLKTFEQNLILDRRAKKTHDALSESFRLPKSSSKSYGQEMYDAAITAAKIQAAVKIREGLHKDEGYTQFLSENDKKKNFNGSTLKLPDKIIDQIQTGLYEHFGVGKLGTALASGKNWTGIQDRMSQSIDSFSTGLAAVIDASIPKTSTGKPIVKKFQQRIDSAVNTAVEMSVDNAIDYLRGIKGTKESKKALSLLGKKKNGTYEYSIDDIYDILSQKAPTGRNAANKEEAENGANYKGLSEFLAALQVYKRSGASELNANDVSRLFELANEITTWFNDSNYDAKTVLDSINSALDQAQIEAEKMAKEQPKIEEKPKSKKSNKSSKKSSSTTPQIEEKKIKETAKTEPKKVEESTPKKAESSPKTEESKKVEKKIEQKQDKTEEIEEPKYSFSPRLTKNNQKKHDSRFTGRLYDQKQLMDFASAPLNRSPKIKSNSGIFDKNGNYYVVSGNKAPDYVYKRIQYKPHAANSEKSSSLRSRQELTDFSKRPATEIPEQDNTEELLAEIDKQIKEELYVKPKRQRNRKKSKKEKADIDSVKRDLKKKNSVYKELQERANSTDATLSDMIAVSDAELNRFNAIKKARSKGVSEKDLKKILGFNAPSNDELEKAISKAQSKKISYSSATATYDKKTPNSYAEKQISQGPVADFDQTRVRSHVDDSYKPKYKVVKKSPTIKTGPKIGYDNGKLYPTADVPDDFSGLKQLSQRESAAGKKLVKTYQDIDKSIITLTQTYEENEETGASGWKNSVSRYSDFKALGTEATKITNKILQQKADLDTEMSKPDDKRNQNKIKELKENIKANQADRREIADIARSIANDTSNDYKFSDFVDAVSKGSREQRNALNATKKTNSQNIKTRNFTDQYKEAIADVKELGKAYTTLQNTILNPKGSIYKKKDGKLGSSYEDSIDQQLQSIEEKEKKIESFNENVHNKNKTSPSKIADQKIYDSYEEELQKGQSQRGQFDDNLVSLLRSAYQTRSDAQNEMLKIIGNANKSGKINKAAYEKQQEKFEKSDYAYNLLKDKVSKRQGLFDTLWSYKDDRWGNIEDRNSILQSNFDTLAKQINDYVLSIEKAGKASDQFKKDFGGIQSDLSKNDPTQFKDSKEGMKEYLDFMTDIQSRFNTNKDFYENGFGKSSLDYEAIKNKLIKSENYDTKTNDYKSKVSGFVEQWNGIIDSYNSGDIEKMKEAEHATASLISTMNDFYKESSKSDKYKKTTSKGTLVEDTVGKVQDINDAKQSLKQFTDEMQLTNKISETIDTSTGKITQKFKDDYSGNIITITSNIDKLNNALRTTQKIQSSGSGGSGGSLLGGLKNLVSGNFKSIVGEIGSSVANVQILGQAFQQMKDGFNTFLDFNKGLTNISYTMDMSKEQLSSLGSSAVDMAKDLSMSLDNTMDIYQIYANMNTTSKEIQETAKPTAILSNLSGVDASTAADQVQGILQQFHMLEDGSTTAADASMHVVDVLDKISGAVGMDYAKGIKVMTDAVQASGQVAFDAGMSYEQLAAISAKVAERTREDGSSIGNALKTIITRTTKVGKMPQYADEVDNATLSNASESLHSVGIDVYNPDGSDRGIITVLSELKAKWDDLSDAQQAKIAFDVAATRQTSKFKSILDAFSESMTLAGEATTTSGNAEANQEKYMESFSGKIQAIKTQMDEFWLNFYNSSQVSGALDFVQGLTEGFTGLEEAIGPIPTLITAVFSALTVKNAAAKGLEFLVGKDGQASGLANAVG